jgi:hypothetical protein
MHMISAQEAARYPFFAALSEWRNEMGRRSLLIFGRAESRFVRGAPSV